MLLEVHHCLARSPAPSSPEDMAVDKDCPHCLGDQYGINGLHLEALIPLPQNTILRKLTQNIDYKTFAVVLTIIMLSLSEYSGIRDTGSTCTGGILFN